MGQSNFEGNLDLLTLCLILGLHHWLEKGQECHYKDN